MRQAIIKFTCDGPDCEQTAERPLPFSGGGGRDPLYRPNPPAGWRELVRPDRADGALEVPTPMLVFHEEACANRWWAEHQLKVWEGASDVEDIPF